MSKPLNIIIDGDPLIYACGFGAESHVYELITEDPDGKLHQDAWSDGNEMKTWKTEHITKGDWTFLAQEKRVTPRGEHIATNIMMGRLTDLLKRVNDHFGEVGRIQLLLSGPGNYREWMATIRGYKSNRKEESKPHYYQFMRNLMCDEWAAEVVEGCEADDWCSILAQEYRLEHERCLVCSIDKDLDQIPGNHYNYQKDVFYRVTREDALLFFYTQALSGDAGDAIPGCYGIGPGKAAKAIGEWVQAHEEDESRIPLEEHLWEKIVARYKAAAKNPKNTYEGELTHREQALETARLVYMQQTEGELWNPPGTPNGTIERRDI